LLDGIVHHHKAAFQHLASSCSGAENFHFQ